jgi:hypothetical protein
MLPDLGAFVLAPIAAKRAMEQRHAWRTTGAILSGLENMLCLLPVDERGK